MLSKLATFGLIIIMFTSTAYAESGTIDTGDTLKADINNAIINITGTFTFTNFSITNERLQFHLNGSVIQWRADTNKTIANITFNTTADNLTFNANSVNGYLNTTATMNQALSNYTFYIDGVFQSYNMTDANKNITVNYNGSWSNHVFTIIPTLFNPPNITSWGSRNNTVDWNTTLAYSIPKNINISLNITTNQTVTTTFSGTANPIKINNTHAYINITSTGIFTAIASCLNANGTCTNPKTWTINVTGLKITISGFLNNTLGAPIQSGKVEVSGGNFVFTNTTGYYRVENIDEGDYTVLARAIGYRNSTNTSTINSDTTINFTLKEKKTGSVQAPGFDLSLMGVVVFIMTLSRLKQNPPYKKLI